MDSLTEEQKKILLTFKSISTLKSNELCISFLNKYNWNIDNAVESLLRKNIDSDIFANESSLDPSSHSTFSSNSFNSIISSYNPSVLPQFFHGTYAECLAFAFSSHKLILIYVHSHLHDDTEYFINNILCSPLLSNSFSNFILFGIDALTSTGFKLYEIFGITKFPFIAIIQSQSSLTFKLLHKNNGNIQLNELRDILNHYIEVIDNDSSFIREQQDKEYEIALKKDKENKERELSEKMYEEKEIKKETFQYSHKLLPEPEEKNPNSLTLLIKLPNGERKRRNFDIRYSIDELFNWIEVLQNESSEKYKLISLYPKCILSRASASTISELDLKNRTVLILEDIY